MRLTARQWFSVDVATPGRYRVRNLLRNFPKKKVGSFGPGLSIGALPAAVALAVGVAAVFASGFAAVFASGFAAAGTARAAAAWPAHAPAPP